MNDNNSIQGSVVINAPLSKVWDVLTDPDKIVFYLRSQAYTDWAVGSPITWEGEMHGAKFQNKGRVLENINNKLLRFTYWSGIGGDKDLLENYSEISYCLETLDKNSVRLIYKRIKIPTAIEKQIFEQFLPSMLDEIKKISEGTSITLIP